MSAAKVAAGFIIFRRLQSNIEYLLLQTSYGEHHWTPPKGHVDPGENEMQTAVRETEEESGLKSEDYDLVHGFEKTLNYIVKGKPKRVVYWLAELKKSAPPVCISHEHQRFEWLTLDKALEFSQYQDMQDCLREADSFLAQKKS